MSVTPKLEHSRELKVSLGWENECYAIYKWNDT